MRSGAYTLFLALIGFVLISALRAQDGNVLKEEDARQLYSFLEKVYKFGATLTIPVDSSGAKLPKEDECGRMMDERSYR